MKNIKFARTMDQARVYEHEALSILKTLIYNICDNDFELYGKFLQNLKLSSQFLSDGDKEENLSIFFRSEDIGGSGSRYTYLLALKRKNITFYNYALKFETSESGIIYITTSNTETGYSIIGAKDRNQVQEYAYSEELYGYSESSAELNK